jgi:hypothetical protein
MSFFLIDIAHSMAELGVRGSETQINTGPLEISFTMSFSLVLS